MTTELLVVKDTDPLEVRKWFFSDMHLTSNNAICPVVPACGGAVLCKPG